MLLMIFRFNIAKAIQATAVVLKQHGGRATRLRVLKLLYIADRELLQTSGRTITGDHPYAFEHGPVLETIYNLMKGTAFLQVQWDGHIMRDPFGAPGLTLAKDPGVGMLNRSEIEKLQEVSAQYATVDDWDLSQFTHTFAEWDQTYPKGTKTSVRIPDDRLLAAVGRGADMQRLQQEAAEDAEWEHLLASANQSQAASA